MCNSSYSSLHERLRVGSTRLSVRCATWLAFVFALLASASDAHAQVDVAVQGESVTSEQGGVVEIRVTLQAPWLAWLGPIEVTAESSNAAEGTVSAPLRLDQTTRSGVLRVTGANDREIDGDVAYRVDVVARWKRRPFSITLRRASFPFVNRDDERDEPAQLEALPMPPACNRSYPTGVSADGATVLGYCVYDDGYDIRYATAWRWTVAGGLVAFGGDMSEAYALSPNGQLALGSVLRDHVRVYGLFRADQSFEPIEVAPPWESIAARVVLDDGSVWGSCREPGSGEGTSCRWTGPDAVTALFGSEVNAADAGGHYGGLLHLPLDPGAEYQATFDGAALPFPAGAICPACEAETRAFSESGATVVGVVHAPQLGHEGDYGFVYSADEGMSYLEDLEGGLALSQASTVSRDGQVIAGSGYDEEGAQAVVWLERAPLVLADVLAEHAVSIPPGYALRRVVYTSADGRVLVGQGARGGNVEAFRAVLPNVP